MLGHGTYTVYPTTTLITQYKLCGLVFVLGLGLILHCRMTLTLVCACQEPNFLPQTASDEQVRNEVNASNYPTINDKCSERGDKNN